MKKRSVLIFFISLAIFAAVFHFGNEALNALSAANVELDDEELGAGNVIEQKVDNELLFLLLGVDENDDGTTEHVRSDTMMLCKVNFETGHADILSIPRDTKVYFDDSVHKINAAHAYGGVPKTIRVVKQLLGLDIDYYVEVDYAAFVKIIDAIGGIEIDSPKELNYPDAGIYIPEGKSRVDGKNALYFSRLREAMNWGDLDRIENQHSVMGIILEELLRPTNITKLPQLLEIYKNDVRTNIPVKTVASYIPKATNLSKDKMESYTLPGYPGNETYDDGQEISWFYMDEEATDELVNELFGEYKLETEEVEFDE